MDASDHVDELPCGDRTEQCHRDATMTINDESSRWVDDAVEIGHQAAGVHEGGVKRTIVTGEGQGRCDGVVEDDSNQVDSTSAFLPCEG